MSNYIVDSSGGQKPLAEHTYFPRANILRASIQSNTALIGFTDYSYISLSLESSFTRDLILEILNGDSVMVHIDRSRFEVATHSQ